MNASMKRVGKAAALALTATAMTLPTAAHSATTLVIDDTVEAFSIEYIFFKFSGGDLSLATDFRFGGATFPLIDPMTRLFVDDGSTVGNLTGALLATNNNGGPLLNSLSEGDFGAGDYVLAVGACRMSQSEARSGIASTPFGDRDFRTTLSSSTGIISVPEPMTWALMLLGMFGIGAAMRRKPTIQSVSVSYS